MAGLNVNAMMDYLRDSILFLTLLPLASCRAYQVSYEYNLKAIAENPDVRIVMPADVASYREYMDIQLDRAGC